MAWPFATILIRAFRVGSVAALSASICMTGSVLLVVVAGGVGFGGVGACDLVCELASPFVPCAFCVVVEPLPPAATDCFESPIGISLEAEAGCWTGWGGGCGLCCI